MKPFPSILTMGVLVLHLLLPGITLAQETFSLPASWKFASGSEDVEAPGFFGKLHQARKNSGLSATIARGNAQLSGLLKDPNTAQPYENLAVAVGDPIVGAGWTGTMPVDPGGTFSLPGVINFHTDADGLLFDNGNFNAATGHNERFFPGLPGADSGVKDVFSNGQNFSVELVAWLNLPTGDTVLGVHHDDSVQIAFHPNDARDLFRAQVLGFDSNSGETDRTVTLNVVEAGLYSVRLMMAQWTGAAMLELYSAPGSNPGMIELVNDSAAASPIMAWAGLDVPQRSYITAVSPVPAASGVAPNTTITIEMTNAETEVQVMRVNGSEVTPAKQTTDGVTTLSYTPPAPFATSSTVQIELDYGAATATWSFNTVTGRKALLITGGGQLNAGDAWISQRLSERFGFDVTVASDGSVVLADAANADLVYNSSTVNSGNVADVRLETLEVPLINVESANTDDFKLLDVPYAGKFGNNGAGGITQIAIDDNSHPITQGLPLGNLTIFTANEQTHYGTAPANATVLASTPNFADRGLIYVIEEGDTVADDAGDFTHVARRVQFGMGNIGASLFNAEGTALFDRVIEWALAKPVPEQEPVITRAEIDPTSGDFVISWLSIPGRTYIIEVHQRLTGQWGDLADDFLADSEESTFLDVEAENHLDRFYRIRLIPPPAE